MGNSSKIRRKICCLIDKSGKVCVTSVNKSSLHLQAVTRIKEDSNGNIWFTTWFEGVCRFDCKSITGFKPGGDVWFASWLQDRAGNIWVGSRMHGTYKFDGKTFMHVLSKTLLDSSGVYDMTEDKAGNTWFCTKPDDMMKRGNMGGVWRYNGKSFKNFTVTDGLGNNTVNSALMDNAGKVWFGTLNTGLCMYDGKTFSIFSN